MRTLFYRWIGFFLGLGWLLAACAAPAPVLPNNRPDSTSAPLLPTLAVSPTPTAEALTPTPEACRETQGSLDRSEIQTPLLNKPMRYVVYRPPCYAANANQRYPVLYLLHGQNYDESQWLRLGVPASLDRLITSGELPPFLVVLPFDYSFKQPSEYKFEQVFIQLLIPQIDQDYRTRSEAAGRAIGGLSRGGAWAIRLGIRHPALFSAIGGHSPAIFYADMDSLPTRLQAVPEDQRPRLWLDAGDKDSEYQTVQTFEKALNELGLPHEWHSYLGWHEEAYWSAHVAEYLRWYAAEWKP